MNHQKIIAITMLLIACIALPSNAQNSKNKKRATLVFDDELVEGGTQKPDLFYLLQKKSFNYKKLIKLRENFLPEMRRTTEDLQRSRSFK